MRNDADIRKDIVEELAWDPILNTEEITVSVKGGVVTLAGTVDTYSKKVAVEYAAKRIAGVKAIALDIRINPSHIFNRTDSEIAHAVVDSLKWNSLVQTDNIRVRVENGWVALEGEVEWEYQRKAAKESIEQLIGVRGVSDLLSLKPKIAMRAIRQSILAAFNRHAMLDVSKITVETEDNNVILKGSVSSIAERVDAEHAAWSVPGVRQVENNLEVQFQKPKQAY